ncbi:MAG: curli production assembly/transport component CsgF [Lutibacter sp.]
MKKLNLIIVLLSFPCFVFSQNLIYKPMNPFFGGDTFNYQQMLSSATAQNDFTEGSKSDYSQPTELENFTESLNRQLLNSLSRDLFQQQIGDEGLGVGTFVFGSLVLDISPTTGGLLINILDTKTGEQTQITIPN